MPSSRMQAALPAGQGNWGCSIEDFAEAAEQRRSHFVRLARRVTPCAEEAEDIVQDALLRAFRNLPQFRGQARITTWLQAIVQNSVREWLREHRGPPLMPLERPGDPEGTPLDIPDTRQTPEEICAESEVRQMVFEEMEKLGDIYRSALQLCFVEEKSQEAAAEALNITIPAIKTRVFQAKRRLRRAMRERSMSKPEGKAEMTDGLGGLPAFAES